VSALAVADAPVDARTRANTELALLVLAVLIVLAAYSLVGLAADAVLPAGLAPYGGAMAALAAAAHLVRRRLAPHADPLLLPLGFLLNGLGLVMVRRIDFLYALRPDPPSPLAPAQTVWTVVGIAAFCATLVAIRNARVLDRYRYLLGVAALVALLLPLLPVIGREINGSQLWLRVAGFSFQPGEAAKLGLVAFFASYLAEKRQLLAVATNRVGPFLVPPARAFGPVVAIWVVSLGVLVFEKDLGLSLLVFGTFVAMLYVATSRLAYAFGGGLLFAAGAAAAWALFTHVQQRIAIWLDLWDNLELTGAGQLAQSLFALGTGGIAGVGLGQGRPDFIPVVESDFIFAAFGEELGLLGTTALLLVYFLLIGRGFSVALRSRDDFGQLLAAGLTILFGLQVFVIIGGVTRLIPLTGLTLPFVSYGGSSLLANYVLLALLARVSSEAGEPVGAGGAR
jgi:cell division protein FtsW (lipid II flippase)